MSKPQTPQRIRITLGHSPVTLYISTMIAREVKEFTMRLNGNILFPTRGNNGPLKARLKSLTRDYPEHFMRSSRELLNSY